MRTRVGLGLHLTPSDAELFAFLKQKLDDPNRDSYPIVLANVYNFHPQELAGTYVREVGMYIGAGESTGYFLTPRTRLYQNGSRPNRKIADMGFWKATIGDTKTNLGGFVCSKKVLVFYEGVPKDGKKTSWIMHEYRFEDYQRPISSGEDCMKLDDWVLTKIRLREAVNNISTVPSSLIEAAEEHADAGQSLPQGSQIEATDEEHADAGQSLPQSSQMEADEEHQIETAEEHADAGQSLPQSSQIGAVEEQSLPQLSSQIGAVPSQSLPDDEFMNSMASIPLPDDEFLNSIMSIPLHELNAWGWPDEFDL